MENLHYADAATNWLSFFILHFPITFECDFDLHKLPHQQGIWQIWKY